MSDYKENIPSDDDDTPIQNNDDQDVQYIDDDLMDQLDAQEDEMPDDQSNDSGFQTFDEGTDAGDESFNDGEILQQPSDAIAHFDDHSDSIYCIGVLEEPVKDGKIVFVSGDGRDKAYVWTIGKEADLKAQ